MKLDIDLGRMRYVYVVTMRRYGDREKHSYIIGVFTARQSAIINGGAEELMRGGKYTADIERFLLNQTFDFPLDEHEPRTL